MTQSMIDYAKYNEDRRHNRETEQVAKYDAETRRKKMVADSILGAANTVTSAINPVTGLISYAKTGHSVPTLKISELRNKGGK